MITNNILDLVDNEFDLQSGYDTGTGDIKLENNFKPFSVTKSGGAGGVKIDDNEMALVDLDFKSDAFTANTLIMADADLILQSTSLTGDGTTSGPAFTLATVNAATGTFGSATEVAQVTVNGKGLVTDVTSIAIAGVAPGGSASGDLGGSYPSPAVAKINGSALGSTTPTSGNVLIGSGTDWVTNPITGDVTITSDGITAIGAGKVTNSMLAGSITAANLVETDIVLAESQITNLVIDLATKLNLSGGTMTGSLILNSDPTSSMEAVTKNYTDMIAAGFNQFSVVTASTANFPSTYSNGVLGVGATLTASSNGAFTQDGVAGILNSDYLFKDQTASAQNGIYVLTTVGTGSTPAILTRSPDYDSSSDIDTADIVNVAVGTVNAGISYRQTNVVTVVGTDPIAFVRWGGQSMSFTGDVSGSGFSPVTLTIGAGVVTNAMLAGSIVDTKLNTISTSGKVANSATTATNANTASTIVSRDSAGDFSAGTLTLVKTITNTTSISNGGSALSGLNDLINFPFSVGAGNYATFSSRASFGVEGASGSVFYSSNLQWDATATTYKYINNGTGIVLELGSSGALIKYAPSGTSGGAVVPTLMFRANTDGSLIFPTLTASTVLTLDSSGILTSAATVSGANGGTGVANTGKTMTVGGNFTVSGAFTCTFTVTANTSVTLPTSGTLAVLAGNTFTAAQIVTPVALTPGATVATNASLSNNFTLALNANTTLSNPTSMVNGGIYTWTITQDTTPRTLNFGSNFKWNGGVAMTVSTGSGAVDKFAGQYDSSRNAIDCWIVTQASS